ncbi:hypothetical protein E2C01_078956 [Portunus trituberculatus]|uniref:Uncharacterized protein n=1 Tax=Portunus trituberculatus TaxID=210409 RepID=A0A5B7IRK9_PORTR|nr:hypothetical protein [Portunus trituberculatus]
MKIYQQNAEECCFFKTAAGLGMHTGIWYTRLSVLLNGTVTVMRRERTELCIQPNVWPFDYQIFSLLISRWC